MADADTSIAQQQQHMEQLRRLMELGFSQGDLAAVNQVLAPGFVEHQAGVHPANAEGVKANIMFLRQIFPDLACQIVDLVAVGDKVWARARGSGTHRGSFMGQPPTGRVVTIDVMDVCRFEDGKIVEHWGVPDRLSMIEQMGLGPRPQQSPA